MSETSRRRIRPPEWNLLYTNYVYYPAPSTWYAEKTLHTILTVAHTLKGTVS
jgi:hypothetical protein